MFLSFLHFWLFRFQDGVVYLMQGSRYLVMSIHYLKINRQLSSSTRSDQYQFPVTNIYLNNKTIKKLLSHLYCLLKNDIISLAYILTYTRCIWSFLTVSYVLFFKHCMLLSGINRSIIYQLTYEKELIFTSDPRGLTISLLFYSSSC